MQENDKQMAEAISGLDTAAKSPPLKRRKIRKGTQSCWECKRRKIRCTFASPNESVCDGCRSRKVNCISQHFEYGLETVGRGGKTGDESLFALNGRDLSNLEVHVGKDANKTPAVSTIIALIYSAAF